MAVVIFQGVLGAIYFSFYYYTGTEHKSWMFWVVLGGAPIIFALLYCGLVISFSSELNYCSVCGGRLTNKTELAISNDSISTLLVFFYKQQPLLNKNIHFVSPKGTKSFIQCVFKSCPKNDNSDVVVNVSHAREKRLNEDSNSTYISYEPWFKTIITNNALKDFRF